MTSLRVLIPDSTSNYVLNPQLRYDTTGWAVSGSTITRVLTRARFGVASLRVVTTGSALREGAFYRVKNLSGISDSITASVYVRGAGKVRIRLIDNPRGREWYSQPIVLNDNWWQRLSITGNCTGSDDIRLYVETDSNRTQAVTFYVDGAQIERKTYPTSYCDGDQPGCRWNLMAHNSISSRPANTAQGGKWVDLAGTCRRDDDIYVTAIGGLGMAPITNSIQSWANSPGGSYQSTKINNRVVTLNFHTKNQDLRIGATKSIAALHDLRQTLINIFRPDVTKQNDALLFEYYDNGRPVYIRMRYEAGLEGEWDIRNRWINSFPVRFVAVDPLLSEDSQEIQPLSFQKVFPGATRYPFWGRINGEWTNMVVSGFGAPDDNVLCSAIGKNGEIYLGGDFNSVSGAAGCSKICYWDGSRFQGMAGGMNGAVYAIAVAPNGDVYAAGGFTIAGGGACARIARWNSATSQWLPLGSGLNNNGRSLLFGPSGELYVGGEFTTAGGVTVSRFARWMNNGWAKVGSINPAGTIYAMALSRDGSVVYIAGDALSGNQAVMAFTISTNVIAATESTGTQSPRGTVYSLLMTKSGILYAGGSFTLNAGGDTMTRLAYFAGNGWFQFSSGADGIVYGMSIDAQNTLYFAGAFTIIGGVSAKHIAQSNGVNFATVDLIENRNTANANSWGTSIQAHPNGDVYFSNATASGDTGAIASYINQVNNPGSSETYPFLYVVGPGVLKYIENQTTKKRVWFNLTLIASEEMFIDFARATIGSNVRDGVYYGILPISDLNDFTLIPGNNIIAAMMTNDVAGSISIGFQPLHWSADAVQPGISY